MGFRSGGGESGSPAKMGSAATDKHQFTGSMRVSKGLISDAPTFRVNSTSNRVGIGAGGPSYKFDVLENRASSLSLIHI